MKRPRQLKNMELCANNLPWVNQFKHLGNTITNQGCFTNQDMNIKRACYVNKNIELNQEFYFADARTKFKINEIYNSHYTGSPLWNLFNEEAIRLESSYNKSVKIMFDLPIGTHRHLIEPITKQKHLRITLLSRFMGFIEQIKKSEKLIPKMFLSHIMSDVRSTTGLNLRNILLQTNKLSVDELKKDDTSSIKYHPTLADDKWKETLILEILDVRDNQLEVDGFSYEELNEIVEHICVG
jgi:hypothetical protein